MKLKIMFFFYCMLFSTGLHALVVGSDSAASRQAAVTFPAVDSDNEVLGFAVLEDGFSLEDDSTTCTFNSLFPVLGDISLNDGLLTLQQDLVLGSQAIIANRGTIEGNNHIIELPFLGSSFAFTSSVESGVFTIKDSKLILNSPVNLNNELLCEGSCEIYGNTNSITLGSLAGIRVNNGATLQLHGVIIDGVKNTNIRCSDSAGTISCDNVVFIQSGGYVFDNGILNVVGNFTIKGSSVFSYQSDQTSTIKSGATWYFDAGMTFSYDPPTAANNLIAMEDATATLHVYETSLHATSTGLQLTKGRVIVEGMCPVSSDASVQAEGISFGDGVSSSNNVTITVLPESGFEVQSGYVIYQNVG